MSILEERVSRRKSEMLVLFVSHFLTSDKLEIHKLGTEQIRQVLCASLNIQIYALKDDRTSENCFHMFRDRDSSASLLNGALFM